LNVPIYSDPAMTEELDMLAREIAGAEAHAEVRRLARGVAEAYFDLRRVRLARHHHLVDALRAEQTDVASSGKLALTASQTKKLLAMDRYSVTAGWPLTLFNILEPASASPNGYPYVQFSSGIFPKFIP
jgi:hypothetical protein